MEYKYVELPSSLYTSFIYVGGNGSGRVIMIYGI